MDGKHTEKQKEIVVISLDLSCLAVCRHIHSET